MSNAPMMQTDSTSFFTTWINALTKPREETYAAIASSPRAKAMTAYLWVFLGSILTSVVTFVVQGETIRSRLTQAGLGGERLGGGAGAIAITLLCGAPLVAILGTALFAIWVALVQWIAKMFGGKGTNDQLAYALAAITAPYSVLSAAFILLGAIPYVGFCFRIVVSLAGLYILFIQIMAVKAVNQFGWGPAAGAFFIPGLALALVCCCAFAIVASLTGAAIGDIFKSINQSLLR